MQHVKPLPVWHLPQASMRIDVRELLGQKGHFLAASSHGLQVEFQEGIRVDGPVDL